MEALSTVGVVSMRRMADKMTPLQMTDLVMALISKVSYVKFVFVCVWHTTLQYLYGNLHEVENRFAKQNFLGGRMEAH